MRQVLGLSEGRSSKKWQDYSLDGHQIVCHLVSPEYRCQDHFNPVGEQVKLFRKAHCHAFLSSQTKQKTPKLKRQKQTRTVFFPLKKYLKTKTWKRKVAQEQESFVLNKKKIFLRRNKNVSACTVNLHVNISLKPGKKGKQKIPGRLFNFSACCYFSAD